MYQMRLVEIYQSGTNWEIIYLLFNCFIEVDPGFFYWVKNLQCFIEQIEMVWV